MDGIIYDEKDDVIPHSEMVIEDGIDKG